MTFSTYDRDNPLHQKIWSMGTSERSSDYYRTLARDEDGDAFLSDELYHNGLPHCMEAVVILREACADSYRRAWLYGE